MKEKETKFEQLSKDLDHEYTLKNNQNEKKYGLEINAKDLEIKKTKKETESWEEKSRQLEAEIRYQKLLKEKEELLMNNPQANN